MRKLISLVEGRTPFESQQQTDYHKQQADLHDKLVQYHSNMTIRSPAGGAQLHQDQAHHHNKLAKYHRDQQTAGREAANTISS